VRRLGLKIDLYLLKECSTSTEVNGAYFIFDISDGANSISVDPLF